MGRQRRAWLWGGTGRRVDAGKRRPGWYVRYNEYGVAGHRRGRSKRFETAAAAREFVKRHNARADLGELDQVVPMRIRDAARQFCEASPALARSTRISYRTALGLLIGLVGDLYVNEVRGPHIDTIIAQRLRVSAKGTVAKHLRGLNRFFAWAIDRGYALANPVREATAPPRGGAARPRPPVNDADLGRLIEALDTEDRRIAVWIGMTTGLDRAVIRRLSADQVDLEGRCFLIKRPKTDKVNALPIHDLLLPLLARRCDQAPPSTPLLRGLHRQGRDRDWWHQARQRAGLPDLQFRDLRAVAASRLMRVPGLSLADAQRLLGHASIQTTARHYVVPDPNVRKKLDELPLPAFPNAAKRSRARSGGTSGRRP